MTTQDLIKFYKNQRSEAKLGQQLFAIPRKIDMVDSQVMYYYVGDRRRVAVDFTKEICLHLRDIPWKPMSPDRYVIVQESTTPMEWLIQDGLLYPFLLFINGHMIRWENITVIASQERYDLLIHGLSEDLFSTINPTGVLDVETEVFTIRLPDSIEYYQGGYGLDDHTLFAFDEQGVLVTSGVGYILIQNYDTNVEVIDVNTGSNATFLFASDPMYKYFPENFCIFENGLYDGDAPVKVLATAAMVYNNTIPDTSKSYLVRIFHNTKLVTPSYDNVRKVNVANIQADLFAALQESDTTPEYMTSLSPEFDPPYDHDHSSTENDDSILEYLDQYDSMLFNRVYQSNQEFIDLEVDYAWITSHLDEDGNLKIPRRFQDGVNFYIIVLVNGELYEYYRMHKYEFGWFYCPIQNMQDGDTIELLYFKNAKNFELNANIAEDEPYLKLDPWIYNNDMRIFSKHTTDTYFNFPEDAQTMFPVDYTLEYDQNDDKALRIRFTNEYYYGKDIVIANCHRFQYQWFDYDNITTPTIIDSDGTTTSYFILDLQDKFYYDNEYDRFLVFYNGKRLINDLYRLVLPYRSTTPFTKAMLYLCVPIKEGDRVEVFYLPHHFNDIWTGNDGTSIMDEHGTITIDKSSLSFSLDSQLYSVWINARKLPNSAIKNISSTKLQITTDLTSTRDVRISTMISDEQIYTEFKDRFSNTESNWDKTIEQYGDHFTLLGMTAPTITDTDEPAFPETIPTVAVMREIIRNWYQANPLVDTTAPFIYDYDDVDQSIIFAQDAAGNDLLDVADSNATDNLNVDREWP